MQIQENGKFSISCVCVCVCSYVEVVHTFISLHLHLRLCHIRVNQAFSFHLFFLWSGRLVMLNVECDHKGRAVAMGGGGGGQWFSDFRNTYFYFLDLEQ